MGKKRNASGEVAHKVDLADGQLEILSSPVTVNSFIGCLQKRGPAISMGTLIRPSDRVRLKNANYAIFSGQIVRLERPIMR